MSVVVEPQKTVMRCPSMGDYNALIFNIGDGWGRVKAYKEICYRGDNKGRPPHIIKWDNGELQTLTLESGLLRFTFDHKPTGKMRRPPSIAEGFSFCSQPVTGFYLKTIRELSPASYKTDYDVMEIGGEGDEFCMGAKRRRDERNAIEKEMELKELGASAGCKPKQGYYKRMYPDL